ncbi:MAG: hypothetical protein ACHREM_22455 [Polyangiales bacterium]
MTLVAILSAVAACGGKGSTPHGATSPDGVEHPWVISDKDYKADRDMQVSKPLTTRENSGFAFLTRRQIPSHFGITRTESGHEDQRSMGPGGSFDADGKHGAWKDRDDAVAKKFPSDELFIVRAPPGTYYINFLQYETDFNLSGAIRLKEFDIEERRIEVLPGAVTLVGVLDCPGCDASVLGRGQRVVFDPSDTAKKLVLDFLHFRAEDPGGNADDVAVAKTWLPAADRALSSPVVRPAFVPPTGYPAECLEIMNACKGRGDEPDAANPRVAGQCESLAIHAKAADISRCKGMQAICQAACAKK